MMDIDHFKHINDTYGHLTGDVVLEQLSAIITDTIRTIDIAGRYGGEEFMIICPETKGEYLEILGERLRNNIMNTSFSDHKLSVTISGGIAQYNGNESRKELIHRADTKLYEAKESGRNRVCN
jgi:diguanylate cyclase (GGDEF)-like protein